MRRWRHGTAQDDEETVGGMKGKCPEMREV